MQLYITHTTWSLCNLELRLSLLSRQHNKFDAVLEKVFISSFSHSVHMSTMAITSYLIIINWIWIAITMQWFYVWQIENYRYLYKEKTIQLKQICLETKMFFSGYVCFTTRDKWCLHSQKSRSYHFYLFGFLYLLYSVFFFQFIYLHGKRTWQKVIIKSLRYEFLFITILR